MWAIVRAVLLGALCASAVAVAAALRAPADTPGGRGEVSAWFAPVPEGWPERPWREARVDRSWARETWELRGDPPFAGGRRGDGFSAQWVQRTGWPWPAFQSVRCRMRTLWDQGTAARSPVEGPSDSLLEGVRVPASALGGDDGVMIVPVVPMPLGLLADSVAWAIPIYLVGVLSRRVRARASASRPPPVDRSTP